MLHYEESFSYLEKTSSCDSAKNIIPCDFQRSSSVTNRDNFFEDNYSNKSITVKSSPKNTAFQQLSKITRSSVSGLVKSLFNFFTFSKIVPACVWLDFPDNLFVSPSIGRKFTGTLFGHRRGHVSFAIQDNSKSDPVLLVEFAISTATLVKDMSLGLVRIALECEKAPRGSKRVRLFKEPKWCMYRNGRKCGSAVSRTCNDADLHVLHSVKNVSVGAGVIPVIDDGRKSVESEGELLYMRARFERVVGNRDSEAFYMMNLDGNGPELSIFLLRI